MTLPKCWNRNIDLLWNIFLIKRASLGVPQNLAPAKCLTIVLLWEASLKIFSETFSVSGTNDLFSLSLCLWDKFGSFLAEGEANTSKNGR